MEIEFGLLRKFRKLEESITLGDLKNAKFSIITLIKMCDELLEILGTMPESAKYDKTLKNYSDTIKKMKTVFKNELK